MWAVVKQFIRNVAHRKGYRVGKYPSVAFQPFSVFDVCVLLLMRMKGEGLSFVQVGANDGHYGDSISKFALNYPWRGILIEPQPIIFEKLRQNYATASDRMIFENIAITGAETSELMLYRLRKVATKDAVHAASVVSSSATTVAQQLGVGESELEKFSVPCKTLDSLLSEHHWHQFDILMIDTEGLDQIVLQTLSLNLRQPLIVQFEHGHLSPAAINLAVSYLNDNGYQVLYGANQIDTIAVHKTYWAHVATYQ